MCNKALIHLSNFVLSKAPVHQLSFSINFLSGINDPDLYVCAYNHYNDILGIHHNDVKCNITLAMSN